MATIVAPTGFTDTLLAGTSSDDYIYGAQGNDTLFGYAGNDYLDGGAGNDSLIGGIGNDTYVVDSIGDVVVENAGEGVDSILSYFDVDLTSPTQFGGYLANVENFTLIGKAVLGTGNALDNSILGSGLANTLDGGAGNDSIDGGGGNDSLIGGAGNDSLLGNAGNDTLDGGAGNDTLDGGIGNDLLDGGPGIDSMIGGAGDDTYVVDSYGDVVRELPGGGTDTIQTSLAGVTKANYANVESWDFSGSGGFLFIGTSGADTFAGANGKDSISGLGGNDTLYGGAGDDTIDGGTGADSMIGGAGNDIYYVDNANDAVVELASEGNDTIYASVSYALSENVEQLVLQGSSNINGMGNSLDNVTIGNAGNNVLDGFTGADTMIGGNGDDTYYVDSLGDVVTELPGGGTDTVFYVASLGALSFANVEFAIPVGALVGTPGPDLINGDLVFADFNDTISGLGGNDTLNGLGGNDCLDGGAGDDSLTGGPGWDTLIGGAGNDTYVIDVAAVDTVLEDTLASAGTDRIEVNGSFSIADPVDPPIGNAAPGPYGGIEELVYAGTSGVTLTGNSLDNYIQSGSGNDCLVGGAGADTMVGGAGNDTYVIEYSGTRADVIVEVAGGGTDQVNSDQDVYLDPTQEIEKILLTGNLSTSASGTNGANLITGNSGDNALFGLSGDDTLSGMAGDDRLDGGLGADCLIGGAGNDTYVLDAIVHADGSISSPDILVENSGEGTDEIRVAASVDLTTLTNFENVTLLDPGADNTTGPLGNGDFDVIGNASANKITGNAGNNYLDGKGGADTMLGGIGNDSYVVDNTGDVVTENVHEGSDYVISYLDTYTLPTNVENLEVRGGAGSTGIGNTTSNFILGNGADNVLKGLDGADTLIGGKGNDFLDGGYDARLYYQTTDSLVGGEGNDTYAVDNYRDVVVESSGVAGGTDTVQLYPTLLSLDLTASSYTYSINVKSFSIAPASVVYREGVHVQFYLDKLQSGDLNYDPATSVPDDTAAPYGSFLLDGNYFYALPDNVERLVTESKAITVNGGQFLIAPKYVYGNAANNYITATSDLPVASDLPFANYIDGQGGNDTMAGGLGNDTYVVDSIGDRVVEASGEGTDLVNSSVTHDLSWDDVPNDLTGVMVSTVENLTLLGSVETIVAGHPVLSALTGTALNFDGYGNSADNVITGNAGNNILDGRDGNDTLDGGAGDDTLYGGAGNNSLAGGTGNNSIVGGLGNDTITAGAGNDTIDAGDGANSVTAGDGNNSILAGLGNDTIFAGTGSDTIDAGNGDNSITAGAGNDSLVSGSGNDLLDGGAGIDTMAGGAGNDTYVVDDLADVITENAVPGTDLVQSSVNFDLSGYANIENLTLTGTADLKGTGNALDNVITGNSSKNTLDGGAGNDTLAGGAGDDIYMVDSALDVVIENPREGTDTVKATISYDLSSSPNVENLTLLGSAVSGTGNAGNNVILGTVGNNILDGGGGVDDLWGGAGDDTYMVSDSASVIHENEAEGTDTVISSASSYTLSAELENLILKTGAGNISGTGNAMDNVITGNEGDNLLDGAGGQNTLAGGAGNDTYVVRSEFDTVVENAGEGIDQVQAYSNYVLAANFESLVLMGTDNLSGWGTGGNDSLYGNSGANRLFGYGGNDYLDGGLGADTMSGGLGNDTYIVDNAGDVVSDAGGLTGGTDTVLSSVNFTLASSVENLTLTGTAVVGTGNSGNNIIIGNDVANNLTGNGGDDSISGGLGDDTITAGSGNDTIDGGSGNNSIASGAGNNWIVAGDGNDTITAGAGNDTINAGDGANSIAAGDGANSITSGLGNDTITSGAGNDTISAGGGDDFITAGDGNNSLVGGAGNDTLTTGIGSDTLYGGDGNDVLNGGAGIDYMEGGLGNDTYTVDNTGDVIVEAAGGGTDVVNSSANYTLSPNIETLNLATAGSTATIGTGNELGNLITANDLGDSLSGLDGRDTLIGGSGADTLSGGNLEDELTGAGGNDSLDGGSGSDILLGTTGALAGASEIDTLTGGTGSDYFILGDSSNPYYNTAANAGDYALITDFKVGEGDLLQFNTLASAGTNVNGYVVGTDIYATGGAANSWIYRDANNNSTADAGDNLIAAVQATGGSGAGGALVTDDLNNIGVFV